jgi:hypothetical protein
MARTPVLPEATPVGALSAHFTRSEIDGPWAGVDPKRAFTSGYRLASEQPKARRSKAQEQRDTVTGTPLSIVRARAARFSC